MEPASVTLMKEKRHWDKHLSLSFLTRDYRLKISHSELNESSILQINTCGAFKSSFVDSPHGEPDKLVSDEGTSPLFRFFRWTATSFTSSDSLFCPISQRREHLLENFCFTPPRTIESVPTPRSMRSLRIHEVQQALNNEIPVTLT